MTTDRPAGDPWQVATVTEIRPETRTAKTFRLALTSPTLHLAGQYYVVRLTAPDGYTASRSYSVASAPSDSGEIELTVERLEGGEVSEFLHDEVIVGDELEVRGPIGLWFVWDRRDSGHPRRWWIWRSAPDGHAATGPPIWTVRPGSNGSFSASAG